MTTRFDNTPQKQDSCGLCGLPDDATAKPQEGCAESAWVKRQFRREGIRFATITLAFICVWVGLAVWKDLDLSTSLSVGLLVAIAGMTFGLMYCDAVEKPFRPKR